MKLTEPSVRSIKLALHNGRTQSEVADMHGVSRSTISDIACGRIWSQVTGPAPRKLSKVFGRELTAATLLQVLRRKPSTVQELARHFSVSQATIKKTLAELKQDGTLLYDFGGTWQLEKSPAPNTDHGSQHKFTSESDDTFTFGFASDQHLCSKYERLDVVNELYDIFAAEGITRVYNSGNWIDGEARFNKHDLHTHGMHAQCEYLAKHYPRRNGIMTYAVTGDDHEGWYCCSVGVDIGRYAEGIMRDHERDDWINLGYMESNVPLVNSKSGRSSMMAVVHPGGGTAYALSYTVQKIIEALDGGEKPAIGLYGHYHKMWFGNIRNVWCVQVGCGQDQTPFMRKNKIAAHIGGGIVKLTQDPKSGAIVRCRVEFLRWFNRGFYNSRWSKSGSVTLPQRALN